VVYHLGKIISETNFAVAQQNSGAAAVIPFVRKINILLEMELY